MTLSKEQIKATKSEFAENLALADLTIVEVAKELNTSQVKIERIFNLKQRSLMMVGFCGITYLERLRK